MNKYLTKIASFFPDVPEDEMARAHNPAWMTEHIGRKYGREELTPAQIAIHNMEHGERAAGRALLHGAAGGGATAAVGYGIGHTLGKLSPKYNIAKGLAIGGGVVGGLVGLGHGYTTSVHNQAREAHEEFKHMSKSANQFNSDVTSLRTRGAARTENMIARRVGGEEIPHSKADDVDSESAARRGGRALLTGLGGAAMGAVLGAGAGKLNRRINLMSIDHKLKTLRNPSLIHRLQRDRDRVEFGPDLVADLSILGGNVGALSGIAYGDYASRKNQVNEMYDRYGITRK